MTAWLLSLLWACRVVETPSPEKPAAASASAQAPPPVPVAEGASKKDAPPEAEAATQAEKSLDVLGMELRKVGGKAALIWAAPRVRGATLGMLRPGQLVFVGTEGEEVEWRGKKTRLLPVKALDRSGWMLADSLVAVTLPVWGMALAGAHDPFENPEKLCETLAPAPWAGGEFRLLSRAGGDRLRYEATCVEAAEDGTKSPATRQGLVSALNFVVLRQETARPEELVQPLVAELPAPVAPVAAPVGDCATPLAKLEIESDAFRAAWPSDPALCGKIKITAIKLPDSRKSYSIDLEGGSHPAEGYLIDGEWVPSNFIGGQQLYSGPDYVLFASAQSGHLKVVRVGTSPASVLEVLDLPDVPGMDAIKADRRGTISAPGDRRCEWLPGRRQYYRCR
jgi:hypothetical protein